jgi:hypothetical protein
MTTTLDRPAVGNISAEEVQRRVAILKRFRELLRQQRERFSQYLNVLDKQKDVIETGSADDLIVHVELEEKIVTDIFAIQKVIDPLEKMYQTLSPGIPAGSRSLPESRVSREESELPSLKAALDELKAEAVIRSTRNRELLAKRMEEIRLEMKSLRANPYALRKSVYSGEAPSLVDIRG